MPAPRLRQRGWHVQWYASAADLTQIAALHDGGWLTCMLGHLGGFGARAAADGAAWQAAGALAAQGAWLKLSDWYRLDAQAPYADLVPWIPRVAPLFGERLVWGSDWPHTLFAPDALPSYGSTWAPVVAAFGRTAADALRRRQPAFYC